MQSMSVTQYRGKQVHTYRKWCTYCKSHFMTQNFKSYSRRVTCGQPACQTKLKRAWYKMKLPFWQDTKKHDKKRSVIIYFILLFLCYKHTPCRGARVTTLKIDYSFKAE